MLRCGAILTIEVGQARLLCPGCSDVNLFRYRERIVYLDPEVPDCAFDLGVAEQQLHSSQVARSPINQRRLSTSE
jgi:hypothetical protein